MHLERIVSLANDHPKTRLQFLAMERSLRATGCDLPILVIPYDDRLFELPAGSTWWELPEVTGWLNTENAHPMMRKYQCLTIDNYQYVDSDICFLTDPARALHDYSGFIASDTEWNKPEWTYTPSSRCIMEQRTSTWQKQIFNAGQFACDRVIYTATTLRQTAFSSDFVDTCIYCKVHDQAGLNLLVFASRVPITNLTLPPHCMESTWAGDYPGEYESLWADPNRKPYIIHWAGPMLEQDLPINDIFYGYLTRAEKSEWDEVLRQSRAAAQKKGRWPLLVRLCNQVVKRVDRRFHVQPHRLTFS